MKNRSDRCFTIAELSAITGVHQDAIAGRIRRKRIEKITALGQGGAHVYSTNQAREIFAGQSYELNEIARAAGLAAPIAANNDGERQHLWEIHERASDKKTRKAAHQAEVARLVEDQAVVLGRTKAYAVVAGREGLPIPTVRRWSEQCRGFDRADYPAVLISRHHGRPRDQAYNPAFDRIFRSFYLRLTRPAATVAYEKTLDAIRAIPELANEPIPTMITLKRRLEREVHPDVIALAREGAEALDRRYPHVKRDRSIFHATQAVNADGHKWDFFVRWPDGQVARPMTYMFQDLCSNLLLGWRTDLSENRNAVRLAAGDMFKLAIPDDIYFDNGRASASKWLTGGVTTRFRFKVKSEEPIGVFTSLGIKVHFTTPFRGQSKPVERAFGDLENHMRGRPELAGAWCGNRVDAKPEDYGSKAVELDVFLAVMDEEIRAYNRRLGRRTDIAAGRSFQQVFDESVMRHPIRKATEAQLRLCMLAVEKVHVSSVNGTIELFGNRYWSGHTQTRLGKDLAARFDPGNLWDPAQIHLYEMSGEYIGTCEARDVVGFNDADAAQRHQRAKAMHKRGMRMQLEAERRMSDVELADLMPQTVPPAVAAAKIVRPVRPQIPPPIVKAPIEHPDRAEVDAAFEETVAQRRIGEVYDESGDADATVAEYENLLSKPRDSWTADDHRRIEEIANLPEIKGLRRRKQLAMIPSSDWSEDDLRLMGEVDLDDDQPTRVRNVG